MKFALVIIIGFQFSNIWTATTTTEDFQQEHTSTYNTLQIPENTNENKISTIFVDNGTKIDNLPESTLFTADNLNTSEVIDVNGTIEEVQKILATNPELPRLSRSEILEILNNITNQEEIKNVSHIKDNDNLFSNTSFNKENISETQEKYMRAMRALLLVLPFNAKNLSESKIQELYTKAPIIRFVGDRPEEMSSTTTKKPNFSPITIYTTTTDQTAQVEEQIQQHNKIPNHHEVYHPPYDTQSIQSDLNYNYEPEIKSTTEPSTTTKRYNQYNRHNHHRRRPTTTTTTEYITTINPERYVTNNYPTTKFSPIEQSVTTVYRIPSTMNPETTEENNQFSSMSPLQQSVTTEYPQRINLKENSMLSLQEDSDNSAYPQTLKNKTHNEFHPIVSRKKTKPTSTTTTELPSTREPILNEFRPIIGRKKTKPTSTTTTELPSTIESIPNEYHQIINRKKTKPPSTTTELPLTREPISNEFRPIISRKKTKSTSTTTTELPTPTELTEIGLDLPHDMKDLLLSFNIDDSLPKKVLSNTTEEATLFVTPAREEPMKTHFIPQSTNYSSHFIPNEFVYETTTQKTVMRDEVKELLASIGLFPDKLKQEKPHEILTTTTTTSTATPDIEAAAESLSPEMKDLLVSFGLLPSANDIQQSSYQQSEQEGPGQGYDQQAASPVVDSSSYLSFKPLPITANEDTDDEESKYSMSSDMKQFLASFGLVSTSDTEDDASFSGHEYRSQKALKFEEDSSSKNNSNSTIVENHNTTEYPHINMDMLSHEMKEVLSNLGFLPSTNLSIMATKRKTNGGEGHIFNPATHLASLQPTEEEARRLTTLLETIKKLTNVNGTISQDEIDALNASISYILPSATAEDDSITTQSSKQSTDIPPAVVQQEQVKNMVPLDQVVNAPDPLSLAELWHLNDENKNEVKRQQENTTTSSSSSETTTKDPGPSLTDLAASFGGGETAPDDANVDEALPPKRPNGLYFLLDWNTFLDVGEEDSPRRVNLRFNPKLGNSRAFLPVTVP